MAGGSLEIIGEPSGTFMAQPVLDQRRHHPPDPAGSDQSVLGPGFGNQFAGRISQTFGDADGAVAKPIDTVFDLGKESLRIDGTSGEKEQMRRLAFRLRRQSAGSGDQPA